MNDILKILRTQADLCKINSSCIYKGPSFFVGIRVARFLGFKIAIIKAKVDAFGAIPISE